MDNMTQTPTEIVGASVEETPVTKPSQDQVNEALGLLGLALKALGKLGIIDLTQVGTQPVAVPAPSSAAWVPQRGAGGRFLPRDPNAAKPVRAPKAQKPPKPAKEKPVRKFPAPHLVDDFVRWFFETPQDDLYSCRCGQYEVKAGDADKGLAHVLLFHSRATMANWKARQQNLPPGTRVVPENGNNIIGIRPLGSKLGVFNANRLLYGNMSAEQLRPQVAAEAAGAVPVPFENVVSKSGGAGLDLARLQIVDWAGSENMVIPPVKRGRQWTGDFYVIKRHFAGALVLRVEDKYFLFDADREELTHCGFNPFFTQLPAPANNVAEAYNLLMPAEVRQAVDQGVEVMRQGEFFFIRASDDQILKAALGVEGMKDAMAVRRFNRLTEDFRDVGDAHYMWMAEARAVEVENFIQRCIDHNGGFLPEGDMDDTFPVQDHGEFRGHARSDMLAAPMLQPLVDRYRNLMRISAAAVDARDGKTVIGRRREALATPRFTDLLKACADPATGALATHMRTLAAALQESCAAAPTDGWRGPVKPLGEAAVAYGVFYGLRLGKAGDTQTRNAHIATGTLLSKHEDGAIYAIGAVTHTGREHRPLHLPGWYKVVSNTATANWSVSGAVD